MSTAQQKAIAAKQERIQTIKAEVDVMRKNAARYLWLRKKSEPTKEDEGVFGEEMDAYIDAEIAREKGVDL